jgi:carboxylesterase
MKEGRTETGSIWLKGDSKIGILFFHGWSSPPDELLPLAKKLNSLGWTVYAPLLKGHGTTPEDLEGVTWRDWEKDAKVALERIKKEASSIFVGGVSMGGNLAMLLSEKKSVSGLILLGAPVKFRFHRLGKAGLYLIGMTKKYRKKHYPASVKEIIKKRNVYLSYPIANAKEVARLVDYTRKNLKKITKPIMILQSDTDHMVTKKTPNIIHKRVKSKIKEIVWMKDVYHVFVNDKRVYEKTKDFILRVSGRSSPKDK